MKKRVLIVSATGGHLDQALAIIPAFEGCDIRLATYRKDFLAKIDCRLLLGTDYVSKLSAVSDFKMFIQLCINVFQFIRIIGRFRPHLMVSTGSEISVPAYLVAMFIPGIRRIHVETTTSADVLSLSGKILQYMCHRMYVQWPGLLASARKNTVYRGRVY